MKKVIKIIVLILLLFFAVLFLTGCDIDTIDYSNTATFNNATKENFTLEEITNAYDDGFAYYIEGTIKNNTNKKYSYVQVLFNLYDEDGAQIGEAMANINNLEANGIWKFKAIGTGESSEVADYKIMEITGW